MKKYFPFFFLFLFSFGFKLSDHPGPIYEAINEDLSYLVDFYKHRHRNPEISLREKNTSKELAAELKKVGYEVTENFGGHGIVGMLKNGPGPMILYRTDMDALPMYEKTKLGYASNLETDYENELVGTMHSCGHDMHMSTWLGAARAMAKMKDEWSGTLMLIGQPAEEIGAGAKMMLDNGLYREFGVPDFAIGLHCSPTIPAGQIGLADGFTMANTESVDIKVFGVGSHGALPHMSIDPVVIASMIVMDLQTIVSRNLKPTESAVVTVGAIKGGIKHNIIPDEVTLKLTVRTYTDEVREMVHRRIAEISKGVAMAAGLAEDKMPVVSFPDTYTPANYNYPEMVNRIRTSANEIIGEANVIYAEPQMVGEDFSRYGQTAEKVPSILFWLGTVPQARVDEGFYPGLHSPFYYPDPENSLKTGVAVMTKSMLDIYGGKS